MPSSLSSTAERLLIVAHALNNPADRAIASKFVDDMKALAACEVRPPAMPRGAKPKQVSAAVLGSALRRTYQLSYEPSFDDMISAL